jgi:hypothetical protein
LILKWREGDKEHGETCFCVCTRLCLIFGNKVWPNIYGNLFGKQIRRCQWCAKQYTSSIACLEVKSYVVVPQYIIESFQNVVVVVVVVDQPG